MATKYSELVKSLGEKAIAVRVVTEKYGNPSNTAEKQEINSAINMLEAELNRVQLEFDNLNGESDVGVDDDATTLAKSMKSIKMFIDDKRPAESSTSTSNDKWWTNKFHQFDDVGTALNSAYQLAQKDRSNGKYNIIIHGAGGFGKSEGVAEFAKHYNIALHYIEVGHPEFRGSQYLGGRDLMSISHPNPHERKLRFNIEESFLFHEYVVQEEGLDAPPSAIAMLKDPLERRGYYQDGKFNESKLKLFIILTNTKPEDIGLLSASHKAVLERFPFSVECGWKSFKKQDYLKVLKYNGLSSAAFAENIAGFCASKHGYGSTISPRMIVKATTIGMTAGEHAIKFVAGFKDYNPQLAINLSKPIVDNFAECCAKAIAEINSVADKADPFAHQGLVMKNVGTYGDHGTETRRVISVLENDDNAMSACAGLARNVSESANKILTLINKKKSK